MSDYTKMFQLAGLRHPGQSVKVIGGKHDGLKSLVYAINWSEGEVLLRRTDGIDRWFPLAQAQILDPDYGSMPDLTRISHETPPDADLPASDNSQGSDIVPDNSEAPRAPGWIPKRKA